MDAKKIKVCVVVPVFNRINLTLRFIKSFQKSEFHDYKLVIIDDGSTDGTGKILNEMHPEIVVLPGTGDLWWSGGTNVGVRYALENDFEYVLTINNDSEVEPDTLGQLFEMAQKNPRMIIGSRIMLDREGTIWALGVSVTWNADIFLNLNCHLNDVAKTTSIINPHPVDCLTGNGTLVPIQIFEEIGLYNYTWCPQYHGDTEFTLRAKAKGFTSSVAMDAVVYNNNYVSVPEFSISEELFSRKSGHYWRPIVFMFVTYAPKHQAKKVVKQFVWLKNRLKKQIKKMITIGHC